MPNFQRKWTFNPSCNNSASKNFIIISFKLDSGAPSAALFFSSLEKKHPSAKFFRQFFLYRTVITILRLLTQINIVSPAHSWSKTRACQNIESNNKYLHCTPYCSQEDRFRRRCRCWSLHRIAALQPNTLLASFRFRILLHSTVADAARLSASEEMLNCNHN